MIPTLTECTTVGVWGPVSSGKTWLLSQWVNGMGRVLFDDVTGSCVNNKSMTHFWQQPRAMSEFLKEHPHYFRVAYHPGGDVFEDFKWCFNASWVLDAPRWLVADEMWQIAPNVSNGLPEQISLLARMPRHVKLGFIGASQRVQDISTVLRSGMRMNVFFWMEQHVELKAVAESWGTETADAVSRLRPLVYDDGREVVTQLPECLVVRKGQKEPLVYDLADTSETDPLPKDNDAGNVDSPDEPGENERVDENNVDG